jgi:hypothetical protein
MYDDIIVKILSGKTEIDVKYDTPEDVKKCLSCKKPQCTNCLRWENGV